MSVLPYSRSQHEMYAGPVFTDYDNSRAINREARRSVPRPAHNNNYVYDGARIRALNALNRFQERSGDDNKAIYDFDSQVDLLKNSDNPLQRPRFVPEVSQSFGQRAARHSMPNDNAGIKRPHIYRRNDVVGGLPDLSVADTSMSFGGANESGFVFQEPTPEEIQDRRHRMMMFRRQSMGMVPPNPQQFASLPDGTRVPIDNSLDPEVLAHWQAYAARGSPL